LEGNESATRKDAIDVALLQWAQERPDLDASPIAVFGRLSRVYLVAQARLRTLLAAYELTPATFDVLANLRRSGPPHRKSAGDIAASSLLSTGGTSFRLDRLEERKLVQRVTGTHDRRVIYVELTTQGCELIDVVMAAHLEQEARMLAGLSVEERAALSLLLRGLERSIGEDLSD
jgi:DNA-binding MarR family transcriptional regulator